MSVQAMTRALALKGVTASEKLVAIVLANYANERGEAWPSQRTVAEESCLTPRTVRAALATLESKGIISRKVRAREDGSRSSDLICFEWAEEAPVTGGEIASGGGEMVSGGVGKSFPGGGEMVSGLTSYEPTTEPTRGKKPPLVPPGGSRLHEDWEPDGHDIARAQEAGLTEQEIERAAIEFRNYWLAKAGSAARKLDWGRTWHNWVLRDGAGRRGGGAGVASRPARPGGGGQGPADFASIVARRRGYG